MVERTEGSVMAIEFELTPEALKYFEIAGLLFIGGFATRALGKIWADDEKRKNWMKPRPKTWEEARAEEKDERARERRSRNEESMALSEEELEKLRPRKPQTKNEQEGQHGDQ